MAELIDWLLVFWGALAAVVYVAGSVLDEQQAAKRRATSKRQSIQTTTLDDWSPSWAGQQATAASNYGLGQSYSSSQAPLYATNDQQQQQHLNGATDYTSTAGTTNRRQRPLFDDYPAPHYGHATGFAYSATASLLDEQQVTLDALGKPLVSSSSRVAHPDEPATDSASIPTASGYNVDCVEWVNSILFLFYTRADKYGPIICENIYRSLNEKLSNITNSSAEYSDLMIEFTDVNREACTRPELTNIRTENESDRSVSANCKMYVKRISLNLSIRRLLGATSLQNELVHYEVVLENLEGKLKSMAMLNDKLIVIQFLEKPDTKIWLKPRQQFASRPLVGEDNLVQIILQTLTQVVVDLYFGDDIDFPQYKLSNQQQQQHSQSTYSNYKNKINTMLKGSASELKRQLKHDFFGSLGAASSEAKERRLFVKIVRARNINYNQTATCLMELDAPNQQAISSTKSGSSNPHWDEHFLFKVTDKSSQLKLELWDSIDSAQSGQLADLQRLRDSSPSTSTLQTKPAEYKFNKAELTAAAKFLGLATIKVDELRRNPVQKLQLALQPIGQPSDLNNSVGGELQVELLFLEHSTSPTAIGGSSDRHRTGASALRKSASANSLTFQQGDVVSIDRKLTPSGYVITTTTITKQQQQQQGARPASLATTRPNQLRNPSPISSATGATSDQSLDLDLADRTPHNHAYDGATVDRRSEAPSDATGGPGRLSRSRSRSRSFLRAIRKRFSFSRTRSRSVGGSSGLDQQRDDMSRSEAPSPTIENLDTPSIESRSRASSEHSAAGGLAAATNRAKSVPTSRDLNEVPTIVINKSRLSESGNAFTFAHPKSQLVIEVLEPVLGDSSGAKRKTRPRYYAISENAASKRKWSRRGLKLHLLNEHQFVACHLAGSSTCHLCGRVFSRRPGKQGYKCRNCHFLSHKDCHVKVDHNCPYATRGGLKLEFIDSEPPVGLINELQHSQSATSSPGLDNADNYRTPQKGRAFGDKSRRMQAKSISMEVDDR